jgi:hypothetical protein
MGHSLILQIHITIQAVYLNTAIFLPLGLPETNVFWSAPAEDWTSKKIWGGSQDVKNDYASD